MMHVRTADKLNCVDCWFEASRYSLFLHATTQIAIDEDLMARRAFCCI